MNFGETKMIILRSCIIPKSWTELTKLTDTSDPTMKTHIDDLTRDDLLEKISGKYETTDKGIEEIHLQPHIQAPPKKGKLPYEVYNMVQRGISPGLSKKEKLEMSIAPGIFVNFGVDKSLRKVLDNFAKAIRNSVTVWIPEGQKIDKNIFKLVNKIIENQIKNTLGKEEKGKFRIMIDFDLPLALDYAIKEEADDQIKQRLIENREKILNELYKNWGKATRR